MTSRERASLDERWRAYEQLPVLREHWYWRPGWAPERSFYTWHLTFAGQSALLDLVRRIQSSIELPGLDLVPLDGLHLTMQGVGFVDEVGAAEVAAIVDAVRGRCEKVPPFRLAVGPVDPDEEGVGLLVYPWAPVEQVRIAVRDAIAAVRIEVPEPADEFRPHITVAYSAAAVPTGPIRERLRRLRDLPSVDLAIDQVQLIALRRESRVYRWSVVASVPLGGQPVG